MEQILKNPEYALCGWELIDGEERNQANPDTFDIPTQEERTNLKGKRRRGTTSWVAFAIGR